MTKVSMTRSPDLPISPSRRSAHLDGMQMDNPAGLGIHFRANTIAVTASGVTLRLQFKHPLVKAVGIPFSHNDDLGHDRGECTRARGRRQGTRRPAGPSGPATRRPWP